MQAGFKKATRTFIILSIDQGFKSFFVIGLALGRNSLKSVREKKTFSQYEHKTLAK
jgi:hypothetical protein